jgi:hypothetical protein
MRRRFWSDQAAKVDGFDKAFTQADKNTDGKLDRD